MKIHSGIDEEPIFSTVASGGHGAIAASGHVRTTEFAMAIDLIRKGDLAQARTVWAPLVLVVSALFAEPNPACIKSALAQMGLIENALREPMQAARTPFLMELLQAAKSGG